MVERKYLLNGSLMVKFFFLYYLVHLFNVYLTREKNTQRNCFSYNDILFIFFNVRYIFIYLQSNSLFYIYTCINTHFCQSMSFQDKFELSQITWFSLRMFCQFDTTIQYLYQYSFFVFTPKLFFRQFDSFLHFSFEPHHCGS